jgi:uncharacterized protein DUF4386
MQPATSDTNTARIAGVLWIIATVASLASVPFLGHINDSNYLATVSANGTQTTVGILLAFIAALASATIAISLYPVLRRYNEGLALGAVGLRLIEGVFYIVGVVCLLSLLALSQAYVKAASPDASFQTTGTVLLAAYHSAGNVASLLAFCLGALSYYYIFYQARLVPRWLSGWGLVGAAMAMAAGLLGMFGVIGPLSTPQVVLALPIAVQEMAIAVWLIFKGFSPSAS